MLFVFLVNDKLYKIALLHCCIVALLHCCIVALLHCCIVALLHCCIVALLHCWIMVVVKIRKYIGVWGNIQSRN